ncbi:hypothetical protein AVEN_199650-1 [Araneus ventricosus]|uniref:Uncharacterized protein n=1 Tax=Araneus ventricosus TaxID=182803 RepID=A0A4Y2DF18_ARAVE|nr:hypothetical protein AVEN_199650-1 [Araneus ventricosus]
MSNNKFFIGLGTTVTSTRVLKPPGGDCSDLFGLKTRQQAQIKPLKGTSSVIDYLLRQQQPADSHPKKPECRNSSLSLVTSMDMPQVTPSSELPSPNDSVKPLNTLRNPTEFVANLSAPTESNSAKEPSRFDINLVGDHFDNLKINGRSGPSSISAQESLKPSHQSSELSHLDDKSYDGTEQIKASSMTLNSSFSTKTGLSTNNGFASSKTSSESGKYMDKALEKKLIRNPITGALTEVKSWNKSNPVISGMSSLQEVKSKAFRSEMSMYSRVISDETLKTTRKVLAKRNPITGEGIPVNPYLPGATHTRIRVIHPPGGISSGIY